MKPIGLLVVLVGCGAKPAEPLSTPAPIAPPRIARPTGVNEPSAPRMTLAFPRPPIEIERYVPDVTEYGRWPLAMADHPSLEPHFDIAGALAEPGVSWTDLCARGAQHRHMSSKQELVDYLDAWCSVAKDDLKAAIYKLGASRHATTIGLVNALKLDVASIAAAHGSAHDLESFLRSGGFLTVDHVDLIAAAYNEVGRLDDALEANKLAATMDYAAPETVMCARMLRAIADTAGSERDDAFTELQYRAMPPKDRGEQPPRCSAAFDEARCWRDGDCTGYWNRRWTTTATTSRRIKTLITEYSTWTTEPKTAASWLALATALDFTWPPHDKFQLVLPALDLALRASQCDWDVLAGVEVYAGQLDGELALRDTTPNPDITQLDGAAMLAIGAHLTTLKTQAHWLRSAIHSECVTRISQLPPMTP